MVADAEVALLLIGLVLLLGTSFEAWGAWERCLLALQLAWMMDVSWPLLRSDHTIVSREEIAGNTAPILRSSG